MPRVVKKSDLKRIIARLWDAYERCLNSNTAIGKNQAIGEFAEAMSDLSIMFGIYETRRGNDG